MHPKKLLKILFQFFFLLLILGIGIAIFFPRKEYLTLSEGHIETKSIILRTDQEGVIALSNLEENSVVKEGDLLFQIDDQVEQAQLKEAKSELEYANARSEQKKLLADRAMQEYIRMRKELDQFLISEEDLQRQLRALELAQSECKSAMANVSVKEARIHVITKKQERKRIFSPFDAYIVSVYKDSGEIVTSGETIGELCAVEKPSAFAKLDQKEISHVQIGDQVKIQVEAYPYIKFRGKVLSITPQQDKTFLIKTSIEKKDCDEKILLRKGMYLNMQMKIK